MPALIICGAADKLIPVAHSKRFNKVLKHSQLQIIKNTGHAPFAEKPTLVFDIMRIFLTNTK
jgi:2-hydroxy-6-oxonona-2,4-dienedioate hydrolase